MSRLRASEVTLRRPPEIGEGAVVSVFRVPPELAGQRVDIFVRSQLHRTSRTRAQFIVRACAYDASGRKLEASMHTILQILSITMFEKMPLEQVLGEPLTPTCDRTNDKQLKLFD